MPGVGLVEEHVFAIVYEIRICCVVRLRASIMLLWIVVDMIVIRVISDIVLISLSRKTIGLNAVFYAELLPKFSTYLIAALADLQCDYFSRHC